MKHRRLLSMAVACWLPILSWSLECPTLLGSSSSHHTIDDAWINDGYCDCRDGADEPLTQACAGVATWPGVAGEDESDEPRLFQCPQQPSLQLSLSKLNDGICDCCDGSDEPMGDCDDDCEALLAEARAAREQLQRAYTEGSKQRAADIAEFAKLKAAAEKELVAKRSTFNEVLSHLRVNQSTMEEVKVAYTEERLRKVATHALALAVSSFRTVYQVDTELAGFMMPLTNDELAWLLVHACQMAGEMESAEEGKTCVPLRLAGLDAGILWQSQTYEVLRALDDEAEKKKLADIIDFNLRESAKTWAPGQAKPSSGRKPTVRRGGRRLEEVNDDDYEITYMDDDDVFDDSGGVPPVDTDDEFLEKRRQDRLDRIKKAEEEERQLRRREPSRAQRSDEDENNGSVRDEVLETIREQAFSTARVALLERSSALLETIDALTNEEDAEDVEEEETETAEPDEKPSFDPMTLPMVRSSLQKLESRINRGLDYAASAKVLVDAVKAGSESDEQQRSDLYKLVAGTLNYGQLSTVHLWQILQAVVSELSGAAVATETCQSPWATSCPPKKTERTALNMQLPSPAILKAGEAFCETHYGDASSLHCAGVDSDYIPAEVADGFLGYYQVMERSEDDPLAIAFRLLDLQPDVTTKEKIDGLRDEESRLESEKQTLESEMKSLEEDFGGDGNAFGPDGELYFVRDKCFSIKAGKYTYELCMFKSASQKEGNNKGRGTDLGRWREATIDEESGQRVWKWANGARCWKGPHRSATAYVTCGAETKVLSAEEPHTCTYEMQIESPVACDEDFRLHHSLE